MKFREIVTEASRNVASGTARTALLASLLSGFAVVAVLADSTTLLSLEQAASDYHLSGGAVSVLAAEDAILGPQCDAAAANTRDIRSGALRAADSDIIASRLPSSSIPTFDVTQGFITLILDSDEVPPGGGVLVSTAVATALGIAKGDSLETDQGTTTIAATFDYPDDGRRRGLGYAILVPAPPGMLFDECWASAWPQNSRLDSLLRTSLVISNISHDAPPTVEQLNQTLGAEFNGPLLFNGRNTRFLFALSGIASLALAFAVTRLRRVEFASNLHAGASHTDLAGIATMESLGWLIPVWIFASAPTAGALREAVDTAALLQISWQAPLAVSIGGLLGTLVAVSVSTERRLFNDFKRRQ